MPFEGKYQLTLKHTELSEVSIFLYSTDLDARAQNMNFKCDT